MQDARDAAALALRHYPVPDAAVEAVAQSFNTLFRVRATDSTWALRVGPGVRIHRPGAAEAEAQWLDELAGAGIPAPRVVRTTAGAAHVVAGGRECMMLTWQAGTALARPVQPADARAAGELAARLHEASRPLPRAPHGVLDARTVTMFDVPDRLSELPDPVFARARDVAQDGIDELFRSPGRPRRIHTDLSPGNLLRGAGTLAAIDFQDLAWGHVEQDVAHSLYGLTAGVGRGELAGAFRAGYTTVRPWPALDDRLLALLIAARHCSVVNLAVALGRAGEPGYLERHATAIRSLNVTRPHLE